MPQDSKSILCPLCKHHAEWFCTYFKQPKDIYSCLNCLSIFKPAFYFIEPSVEEKRYRSHNNNINDERYQEFVSPITNAVKQDFTKHAKGLDYGCGTGPVATHVLQENNYNNISLFDPYFHADYSYKNELYDFIICCEVMEHFHDPNKEFEHFKQLLKPSGKLYCKTKMIPHGFSVKAFKNWHYKNDPTHVFFYSPKTLKVICHKFGYKSVSFDEKLITFTA